MVVIRLARGGSKKRPFYNIVVTDSRNRRDGRFNERIGFYNPVASGQAPSLSINEAALNEWVSKGAQPSPTVLRLYKQFKKTGAAAAPTPAPKAEAAPAEKAPAADKKEAKPADASAQAPAPKAEEKPAEEKPAKA